MGTRAMISVDGKPMIATHWDGYPDSLGRDLKKLKSKDIQSIIEVAKKHTIDFADNSIRKKINEERIRQLAKKHRLSEKKIKEGIRRGGVISAEDYEISPIKGYGDFAEFQYDIDSKTGKIRVRELSGMWGSGTKGKWKQLSKVV